jgi:glutamate-1-semialdehyde 2,1-aminomutase
LVKAGSGLATFGQPSSAGIPKATTENTVVLPLDDEEPLKDFFDKKGDRVAAVIIEGIPANNGLLVQRQEYLENLRALSEKHGALLIFDEVITGFRLGLGGAAAHYGITPDLLTFGKVIGGGMPVGAFGGRAEVMDKLSPDGPVYQAGTLSGNPVAMVAGLTTLRKLTDGRIYHQLKSHTSGFVDRLKQSLSDMAVTIPHIESIFWIAFQDETPRSSNKISSSGVDFYNDLHAGVLDAGIYLPPSGYEVCFVSAAHTEEMLTGAANTLAAVINSATDN